MVPGIIPGLHLIRGTGLTPVRLRTEGLGKNLNRRQKRISLFAGKGKVLTRGQAHPLFLLSDPGEGRKDSISFSSGKDLSG
jgi:hypothetical protein